MPIIGCFFPLTVGHRYDGWFCDQPAAMPYVVLRAATREEFDAQVQRGDYGLLPREQELLRVRGLYKYFYEVSMD